MKIAAIALMALAIVGCASVDREPSMAGAWSFQVTTAPNAVTHGQMALVADGEGYHGTLTTDQGANTLTVRSLRVEGGAMHMAVESPDGPVTFEGALAPGGASFDGVVTYHTGQRFPMSGTRG